MAEHIRRVLNAELRMLHTHTQQQQQPFYGPLSGTTRVSRYQKKHSPTNHPDHHPIFTEYVKGFKMSSTLLY